MPRAGTSSALNTSSCVAVEVRYGMVITALGIGTSCEVTAFPEIAIVLVVMGIANLEKWQIKKCLVVV